MVPQRDRECEENALLGGMRLRLVCWGFLGAGTLGAMPAIGAEVLNKDTNTLESFIQL